MDYAEIKEYAKAHDMRVTDLIALAPANDPFYVGTPSSVEWGEWFADLWQRFGLRTGAHVRRVHYVLIAQPVGTVLMPDGKPYLNTQICWGALSSASKQARYLHLVDAADFDDMRSPAPQEFVRVVDIDTRVEAHNPSYFSVNFLPFPAVPSYRLDGFDTEQRYRLEIWCEKSTMNDVLVPLARQYGATIQIGVGELSITRTLDLIRRIESDGRPARIFYISDFDPAGKSMPVAVARKLEFFRYDLGLDIDARLFPLVLTEEQCLQYRLPRTPIKDSERRGARFEERYGEGATELDALEALYPGELRRILEPAIQEFYDTTLERRVRDARRELEAVLTEAAREELEPFQPDVDALREEYATITAEVEGKLLEWDTRRQRLWEELHERLEAVTPDLMDYPVPEPEESDEDGRALYDSSRDYLEQLSAYKVFQGKE